jgi:hypothetical protein
VADPNSIADIFRVQVRYLPTVATGRFGFANPTFVSEFDSNPSFTGRIKAYTGTVTDKTAALIADGFTVTSDAYRQVQIASLQDGPPRTVYVGRSDPADLSWGASIAAIKTESVTDGLTFYAFTASTRDVTDIESIADYLEGDPEVPVFAFYLAQTADANILADNPGNLARNIHDKGYQRMALLWHDPEHSSRYGPAILQSVVGTFNIADGDDIWLRIDGGATQVFEFAATAAALLGSNPETFAVNDGDELIVAVNGGSAQTVTFDAEAATVLSSAAEPYNFTDGMGLAIRVEGGAPQAVLFNGTAGEVATTTGAPWALVNLETVTFAIDGGPNQVVTFATADFVTIGAATAAELKLVYEAQLTGVVVTSDGTDVTVTSARLGSSSDVEIVAGTGGALATLGYVVGNNAGTGFALFLDEATAAEVATEINADTTDCTAAAEDGRVRITSDWVGTSSRIQVTGGTANTPLSFDTNEYSGDGDFADASAATALEVVEKINASVSGLDATVDTGAVLLTSRQLGTGSSIDVSASALATELGLSLTAEVGTGDFDNAALATAAEIALVISATITDGTASSASSRVLISSTSQGAAAVVQATGGSLLTVLRFTSPTTGVKNLAYGVGVLEDFADAAWMGRCFTFNLDATDGAALWDDQTLKASSPTGRGTVALQGDRNLEDYRELLHETLRVNTYENRGGRNETHFGTLLNNTLGAGGYIDVRTTIDWYQARISEKFKSISDAAADAKKKYPYLQPGIDVYSQGLSEVCAAGDRCGHTVFDDSSLDLDNPQDTGIFVPTIAMQSQLSIDNRLIDFFRARQMIKGGIQRGNIILDLIGPSAAVA